MTDDRNPLIGEPVSSEEQKRAAELSEWAESEAFSLPEGMRVIRDNAAARALVSAAIGGEEVLRPVLGRPALDGTVASGPSPKRQVRLPRDIDALLLRRAEAEHRTPSELMRDAITAYVKAS